jgi:hypothetical protein
MKETLEVQNVRLELEACQIDFRQDKKRLREFYVVCEALGRSKQLENLIVDTAEDIGLTLVGTISAIATGVQLGMDIQKRGKWAPTRTTEPGTTPESKPTKGNR